MHTTAIPYWEKAVEIDPGLVNAYYNLGLVYQDIGRQDEAIEAYKRVLDINADDKDAHKNLGLLYRKKGMHVEAEAEFAIYNKLKSMQGRK